MTQEEIPKPGEMYRHFKGGRYEIIEVSGNEVRYKALYLIDGEPNKESKRTLDNFFETVEKTLPNGAKYFGSRFVRD
jgi:hypothetical protein